MKLSLALPDFCNTIQAEIMTVMFPAVRIRCQKILYGGLVILTNKAPFKSLKIVYTTPNIPKEARWFLKETIDHLGCLCNFSNRGQYFFLNSTRPILVLDPNRLNSLRHYGIQTAICVNIVTVWKSYI